MDTESLYVMIGLLVFGLCGTVYFLKNYMNTRKRRLEKEKEEKRTGGLNNIWLEKRAKERMSIYEFKKMAHLINPITFTNGITVSFVEKKKDVGDMIIYTNFGVEYEIKGELYYDILYYDYRTHDIVIDNKYFLEDLKEYDWIIEIAYNLTQASLNKKEEKEFKLISKINQ